ncbi:putative enoyl-CoA hydratase [Geobacillus sp. BCO2]|nr:putative enoyl-CoA hydratase [Geobacillus sp. BCO2]
MSTLVSFETQENGIAIVTLNRPEAANALSRALLFELGALFQEIKFRKDVRVVMLTGAGEKVFCAGADLKERAGMNETEVRQTVALISKTINEVEKTPQPVIAALNGSAFGGGLELALACDIRFAADDIQLGLTETSLGIIPGAGGTQRLPRLVGLGKAKELILPPNGLQRRKPSESALSNTRCRAPSSWIGRSNWPGKLLTMLRSLSARRNGRCKACLTSTLKPGWRSSSSPMRRRSQRKTGSKACRRLKKSGSRCTKGSKPALGQDGAVWIRRKPQRSACPASAFARQQKNGIQPCSGRTRGMEQQDPSKQGGKPKR